MVKQCKARTFRIDRIEKSKNKKGQEKPEKARMSFHLNKQVISLGRYKV